MLDDGDAPKIAVAKRYVLPHERWLTNYWVQRLRANPRRDVAQAERKNGAESFWLDSVAFVDLELSLVIILPGLLLSVVVVGKVFHEVTAALVTGACFVVPGAASYVLSAIRRIQSYRARAEYRRAISPVTGG